MATTLLPDAPSAASLYAASARPEELAQLIAPLRDADIAELLNALPPDRAARRQADLEVQSCCPSRD